MNAGIVARNVVRFIASASSGTVVSNIIRSNTPANLSNIERGLMIVGELVVSSVISDLAADYVIKEIDEFGKKPEKPADPKANSNGH